MAKESLPDWFLAEAKRLGILQEGESMSATDFLRNVVSLQEHCKNVEKENKKLRTEIDSAFDVVQGTAFDTEDRNGEGVVKKLVGNLHEGRDEAELARLDAEDKLWALQLRQGYIVCNEAAHRHFQWTLFHRTLSKKEISDCFLQQFKLLCMTIEKGLRENENATAEDILNMMLPLTNDDEIRHGLPYMVLGLVEATKGNSDLLTPRQYIELADDATAQKKPGNAVAHPFLTEETIQHIVTRATTCGDGSERSKQSFSRTFETVAKNKNQRLQDHHLSASSDHAFSETYQFKDAALKARLEPFRRPEKVASRWPISERITKQELGLCATPVSASGSAPGTPGTPGPLTSPSPGPPNHSPAQPASLDGHHNRQRTQHGSSSAGGRSGSHQQGRDTHVSGHIGGQQRGRDVQAGGHSGSRQREQNTQLSGHSGHMGGQQRERGTRSGSQQRGRDVQAGGHSGSHKRGRDTQTGDRNDRHKRSRTYASRPTPQYAYHHHHHESSFQSPNRARPRHGCPSPSPRSQQGTRTPTNSGSGNNWNSGSKRQQRTTT